MDNVIRSIVRRVARTVRYRTYDQLIGVRVEVADPQNPITPLLTAINRTNPELGLTEPPDPDPKSLYGTFLKYGFFKVALRASNVAVDSVPVAGASVLEELGFVSHNSPLSDSTDDDFADSAEFFLNELLEEARAGQVYLLVFLSGPETLSHGREIDFEEADSARDLPITFTITDACLTNAPTAWLNRHFYL